RRGGSRSSRHAAPCKEHAFVLTNQQMKLIDRFVSRELIVNLLFAIFVLSLVLVVGNIFRKLLPLLVNHDVPVEYLVSFIAYVLPFSLIFTIPWGLLTAILLVFGRLSADNELIALRSNGVSVPRVCISLVLIALVCTGISLWLNVQVAPAAQEKLRSNLYDLATRNPMALFASDQVIDEFPGRKIYVGKKDGNKLERSARRTELNKRFSAPFSCIAFALVGVPLGITAHRRETTIGFLMALVIGFSYFVFWIVADTLRNNPKVHPELLVWVPNVL